MDRLLHVSAGVSLLLLVMVLISVRRAHIRVEYSVSWLIAASAMLVLSLSPAGARTPSARLIGLAGYPADAFSARGAAVFLIMFFRFSAHRFSLARRQHRPGAARRYSGVPPPHDRSP
jgi:hypothetical protein